MERYRKEGTTSRATPEDSVDPQQDDRRSVRGSDNRQSGNSSSGCGRDSNSSDVGLQGLHTGDVMVEEQEKRLSIYPSTSDKIYIALLLIIGLAMYNGGDIIRALKETSNPNVPAPDSSPYEPRHVKIIKERLSQAFSSDTTGEADDYFAGIVSKTADVLQDPEVITSRKQLWEYLSQLGNTAGLGETYVANMGPVLTLTFDWMEKGGQITPEDRKKIVSDLRLLANLTKEL